jgi:hypothetical protein
MKQKDGIICFYRVATRDSTGYSVANIHIGVEPTIMTLTDYIHSTITNDYEMFHDFKLLELETNVTLAGHRAYRLLGKYQDTSGSQKIIDVGTIVDSKVYYVQYIVNTSEYSNYLPILQHMTDSLGIRNLSLSYTG